MSTWKVQDVLLYKRAQKSVEELSLKEFNHKLISLTLLLALTSAARVHELPALDLTYLVEKEDQWEFVLNIHVSIQWCNIQIYLPAYKKCKHLGVVHTKIVQEED